MSTTISGIGRNFKYIASVTMKPAIIFNKTCPATIFAASLSDKVIGRAKKVNNSIMIISGASHHGVPRGKNREKKWRP